MQNENTTSYRGVLLLVVYAIGLVHWYLFFSYNSPDYHHQDWPLIHQIYDVVKQGFISNTIPYHATLFATDTPDKTLYGSLRYFANAWVVMPPQLILLNFISVIEFIKFQHVLFYSLSFSGLYNWIKQLDLSPSASFFLLISFLFNGLLVSRTSIGHGTLVLGQMLIPWFLWVIYKFTDPEKTYSLNDKLLVMLKLSFLLFLTLLCGDMHVFYQMVLVSGCILIFYPKRLLWYFGSILIAIIMSFWYFLPMLMYSGFTSTLRTGAIALPDGHWRISGIGGYGVQNDGSGVPLVEYIHEGGVIIHNVFAALVNTVNHLWESLAYPFNASYGNVWEYNLYISPLGVLLIIGGLISITCKYKLSINHIKKYRFVLGLAVVVILSVLYCNRLLIQALQTIILFSPIDAIPSRLMVYPFTAILIISAIGVDDMFRVFHKKIRSHIKWLTLLALLGLLLWHSFGWFLFQAEIEYAKQVGSLEGKVFLTTIYDIEDISYKMIVNFSYITSCVMVSLAGFAYYILHARGQVN